MFFFQFEFPEGSIILETGERAQMTEAPLSDAARLEIERQVYRETETQRQEIDTQETNVHVSKNNQRISAQSELLTDDQTETMV